MTKKTTVIKANSDARFNLQEILSYHELFSFFALRDIKLRYRHITIAIIWATIPPLTMSLVFNFTLGKVIQTSPPHVPYILFAYLGLIFWNYFSSIIYRSSNSLISNQALITKIYFPRIILPISSSTVSLVDFFFSLVLFCIILLYYQLPLNLTYLAIVIPNLVITFLFASGLGVGFAALNVKYKDIRDLLPLLTSLLFFLTPVIYPVKLVSDFYYPLLYFNPMMGVIDTSRTSLFEPSYINWHGLSVSFISALIIFCSGALYFKKTESEIIDRL